ncbi:MAG: oligosaccharide flippase family protein, partial [Deltaproteobacteria bacterium]|nr:oligosaccharide flippase family protein [Deltaproteobacteria bacterium]
MAEDASLKSRVQVAVPWSIASVMSRMLISLLGVILLVRYLAPAEYGIWVLLLAMTGVVKLLVSLGYDHFFARFVPGLRERSDVSMMVWPIFIRLVLRAIIACGFVLAAFPLYSPRFGLEGSFELVLVYQIAIVSAIGSIFIVLAFSARFLQREVLILTVPHQVLMVAATALGIWLELDLLYFVAMSSVLGALNLLVSVAFFRAEFRLPPLRSWFRPRPQSDAERKFRRASYVSEYGVTFLNTEVDRYLIAALSNRVDVAIYALATNIVERLRLVLPTQLFRPLMEATFYRRFEETGDRSE